MAPTIFTWIFWASLGLFSVSLIIARVIYLKAEAKQGPQAQIPWLNSFMGWFMPVMLCIIGFSGYVMFLLDLKK